MSHQEKKEIFETEWDLIKMLRDEAREVKDCYTKFSFQALTFTVAVLGVTIKFLQNEIHVAFISLSSTIVLLAVARIGTFKYGTANRNFGYDLHLHLTLNLKDNPKGWQAHMRKIGWEEAMRAWRVIQATMFAFLYSTRGPRVLKKSHRKENKWFEPKNLIPKTSNAKYYAGSYLKTMNSFLHLMAIISLGPIFFATYTAHERKSEYYPLYLIISVVAVLYVSYIIYCNYRRREILEDGLLSIHSCATTWLVVVVTHFRVLDRLSVDGTDIISPDYTKYLAEEAKSLISNDSIFKIDQWINGSINKPAPKS